MMKEENWTEKLLDLYEQFDLEEDSGKKKKLQELAVQWLEERRDGLTSDDYQIWGLLHYMSEDEKDVRIALALEKFLQAYEMDETNFWACLYIAHCYHDQEAFEKALNYYEKVDKDAIKEYQLWRFVKLIEQQGHCHFKLGNKEEAMDKFADVVQLYRALPIREVAYFPKVWEMMDCLTEKHEFVQEIQAIEEKASEIDLTKG